MKKHLLVTVAAVTFVSAWVGSASAQTQPSVTTDQPDYAPRSTARISGAGFQPGEIVRLQVLRTDLDENAGAAHHPWRVTASADGDFQTTWYVTMHEADATLQLTATGLTSGLVAQRTFTDSASTNYFRTQASGNWNSTSTWQSSADNVNWSAATLTPNSSAKGITIQTGNTVTVTAGVTVDQVVVQSGGQITVNSGVTLTIAKGAGAVDMSVSGTLENSGGTVTPTGVLAFQSGGQYLHNFTSTAGTIPNATWNAGSTCEIIGYTGNTQPGGLGQAFYHFTWNTPAMANAAGFGLNAALTNVNGDFTVVATGTGGPLQVVGAAYNSDCTLNIGGRLYVQGGTFTLAGASYKNYTLNIASNLVVSGGTFNLALDQQKAGSTTYTPSGNRTLNLGGSYNQTGGTFKCDYLQSRGGSRAVHFRGPGKSFTQSAGTMSTTNLDLFVDNGASLTLNNNLSVSKSFTNSSGGTLNCGANVISGAGTFSLNSGATLGIGSTAGISASGSSGNIQTTTRSYNSAATYAYNGTAPQVTGAGLPSAVTSLTLNNSAGVTLSATTTVNGVLTLTSGQLLTGCLPTEPLRFRWFGRRRQRRQLRQRPDAEDFERRGWPVLGFPHRGCGRVCPRHPGQLECHDRRHAQRPNHRRRSPQPVNLGSGCQPFREPLLDADAGRRVGRQR